MEPYNELLGILERVTQHKINLDEAIQVSCIIEKLPPCWKDFKHILKHLKKELTLVELTSHLRIEESLRVHDSDKPKGNNVVGPSVVNMVEHNNSSKYNDNKGKRKHQITQELILTRRQNLRVGNVAKLVTLKEIAKVLMLVIKPMVQDYYVTYVSEAYFVQDDDVTWWVDSGVTVHACKDRSWFKTYESLNDGSILHIGNESTTLVQGRGCGDLRFSSGKIVSLFNVLHVPNIRLNIINDNIGSAFTLISKLNDSILWHARLGHVHYKRMQDMSKDELIPAFDMDTEKCNTCMLTKITKKPFHNVKRETKVLKRIQSDLCDLHATPSLGNKKYFVTFIDNALREVVRLPDPKLKTLGERGIECIFIIYAKHSKAFRFYVIEPNNLVSINSIIESTNAIFDENKFYSVPRPSLRIPNGSEDIGGLVVLEEMDVKTTLLNDELDEDVYMNQHQGSLCLVDMIKEFLSSRFSMKDMREADVILGIRIKHESNGIAILQSHYIEKVLKKSNNGQAVSQLEYSRMIGCLMYAMTCKWHDFDFAVGKMSRCNFLGFQETNLHHWFNNGIRIYGFSSCYAATLAKAYSQMYNEKSRHLGVRHSMIRELITNGVIFTEFEKSENKGRVPTEMELELKLTQQGSSYEVSVAVCSSLRSPKSKRTIESKAKRSSKIISLGHESILLASSYTVKMKMEILLEPTSNKLLVANELMDAFGKPFEVLNNVFEHQLQPSGFLQVYVSNKRKSLCSLPLNKVGFTAVLAVLKPEHLKADRARMYEEASKVELCPSEIILNDLLALDSIVRFDLGDQRLEQTATFLISTNSKVNIKDHSFSPNSEIELLLFDSNCCVGSVKKRYSHDKGNFTIFFHFKNNEIGRKGEFTNFNEHIFSYSNRVWISLRSQSKRARGKNWLMKAVHCSSHVSIVPSLSSSNHVFASSVSDRRRETSLGGQLHFRFRNGDCGTRSRSDNTIGSPHGFIIYGIEIFKGNEKVTEGTLLFRQRILRFRVHSGSGNGSTSLELEARNSFEIPGSGAKNFDVFQKL
nr:zinc finger, CCHC-type [Tanacetum cinerariifolium]